MSTFERAMSMKVGLGASQEDLEVQGEIDFDFFEEDESDCQINDKCSWKDENAIQELTQPPEEKILQVPTPSIVMSCPEEVGACCKEICIDIPSPENYISQPCSSIYDSRRRNLELASFSPHAKYGEDPLGSPISSSSASDFSSSSSFSFSDEDSVEETDSMTDVSPLPSNCNSPVVTDVLVSKHSKSEESSPENCPKEENGRILGVAYNKQYLQKSVKVNELMRTMKQLEIDENVKKPKQVPLATNGRQKRNPSFTNEEVRRIDQENQRLLKRIIAQQNRTKPNITSVYSRPSSSSVNRQKQQRQIELDNVALLQRLESAKPSKDLSRSHLLNEYKRRPSVFSTKGSSRPVSSASMSMHSSCRNSAHTSGRSSTLTVSLCQKAKQQ